MQNHTADAIDAYRRACELDPQNARVLTNLSGLLAAQGRTDEAMTCVRRALELDNLLSDAHRNLAVLLAGRNQVNQAVAEARIAVRLDPADLRGQLNLAVLLDTVGQPAAQAIEHYAEAAPAWTPTRNWPNAAWPGGAVSSGLSGDKPLELIERGLPARSTADRNKIPGAFMASTQTKWQYLERDPKSSYHQLSIKGRRIKARTLYGLWANEEEPRTIEQIAENYSLPIEAVKEAIAYVESDPPELQQDYKFDEMIMEAAGMNELLQQPHSPTCFTFSTIGDNP